MPVMRSVLSSHIAAIGYEDGVLSVQYSSGRVAHYSGVPPEIGDKVVTAPSVGEALWAEIRGKYPHVYGEQGEGGDGS